MNRLFQFTLSVEPHRLGATYDTLPLHCTVLPWFRTTANLEYIVPKTEHALRRVAPIHLQSEDQMYFGKKRDIPVHVVYPTRELCLLHMNLWFEMSELGVESIYPQWIGTRYAPHVTTTAQSSFPPATQCHTHTLNLVEAIDPQRNRKHIAHQFDLR